MRCARRFVGLVVTTLAVAGCSQGGSNPPGGTGGRVGTGGSSQASSASGGAKGSGGSTGSGGATSTGGSQSTGGSPGTGGVTGSGGKGAGGASAIDAAPGGASGGSSGIDAALAAGGTGGQATGGTNGMGGAAAMDGGKATGGALGSGGSTSCGSTAASLRAAADCTGRLVGVALSTQHLSSDTSYSTAAKELNFVTPENEMKWDQIEPQKGQFTWTAADQIVSFATSNNMKVKGHTLVWYNQLPQWVQSLSSESAVRDAMVSHIQGVMQHYKGKVAVWDVVNEAVSIDGTSYRDCPFYQYLGETYIDEAFKTARAVDANVKLYYNDYNDEGRNGKSDFVYNLLKRLVSSGVPIDGVGMQMHYGTPNDTFTIDDLKSNIQRIVDLGLEVVFSEMDVHRCQGMTDAQQATLYHDLVAACVGEPQCKAVTFWGITDKYSWLNSYSPLGCTGSQKPLGDLWDDNYKKKSAYTGVLNALLGL